MGDPIIDIHRKELTQRLQTAALHGGWEGTHTDFKRQMGPTPKEIGKLIRHMLAFTNTPRRTDAFIIFGVDQDKSRGVFTHYGITPGSFPSRDKLESLIHEHTTIRDFVVDDLHIVDGRVTPYIVV